MPYADQQPNVECSICGKPVFRTPKAISENKRGQFFCGQECYGKSCRKPLKHCPVCGINVPYEKRAVCCSRECADVIRTSKTGRRRGDKRSWAALRVKAIKEQGCCNRCGYRKYPEILQAHHIDKDRTNNIPENLELLCPTCHVEHHIMEGKPDKRAGEVC